MRNVLNSTLWMNGGQLIADKNGLSSNEVISLISKDDYLSGIFNIESAYDDGVGIIFTINDEMQDEIINDIIDNQLSDLLESEIEIFYSELDSDILDEIYNYLDKLYEPESLEYILVTEKFNMILAGSDLDNYQVDLDNSDNEKLVFTKTAE